METAVTEAPVGRLERKCRIEEVLDSNFIELLRLVPEAAPQQLDA